MKRFALPFVTLAMLLAGCPFGLATQDITVRNESVHAITDITLSYEHSGNGLQTIRIDAMQAGQTRTFTVRTKNASLMTYMSRAEIEYTMNDRKYNSANNPLEPAEYMNSALLGESTNARFTVKNEGFVADSYSK